MDALWDAVGRHGTPWDTVGRRGTPWDAVGRSGMLGTRRQGHAPTVGRTGTCGETVQPMKPFCHYPGGCKYAGAGKCVVTGRK